MAFNIGIMTDIHFRNETQANTNLRIISSHYKELDRNFKGSIYLYPIVEIHLRKIQI